MELFDYILTYEKIVSLKAFKCSHCNRIFSTQVCNGLIRGRVPLLMPCSHTICEECIIRMAKTKKINCKICHCEIALENPEKWPNMFPVDRYMFGALLNLNTDSGSSPNTKPRPFSHSIVAPPGTVFTSFYKHNLKKNVDEKDKCSQKDCRKAATVRCINCFGEIYCSSCDKRIHESIRILNNHLRYSIDVADLSNFSANCNVHLDLNAEYYCITCEHILCSKCVIKEHSGHEVMSIEDKNTQDLPGFRDVLKKARYLLKCMETTVKNVKSEIGNTQQHFKPTQTEYEIIKHFSMLHSTLQILEASMLDKFYRGQASKIDALHRLSDELTSNIKILEPLISTGVMLSSTGEHLDKLLISELEDKINSNMNLPCEIVEENKECVEPELKFVADNSIVEVLQKHCQINVEDNVSYKLIPKTNFDASNYEADNLEVISASSESDSLNSSNCVYQSPGKPESTSSASSTQGEFIYKRKGCRTRVSLSGNVPVVYSSAPKGSLKSKHRNDDDIVSLTKGKEESINVTHITHPLLFYVQLNRKRKYIDDLNKKYANYAEHALVPTSIEIGKLYIVQYSDNKGGPLKWYRGRVLNILLAGVHNLYEIFFIDYGNTSIVALNKIREIKNVFANDPAFAYQCRLHGIIAQRNHWDNNVLKDMVEFVSSNSDLKMYIINNENGILDVNLFTYHSSLNEFLIVAGYAQEQPESEVPSRRKSKYNETKIATSIENFQKNEKYLINITHIIDPQHMYCQLAHNKDVIMNLEIAMSEIYNKYDTKQLIFNPKIGMFCAALLTIQMQMANSKDTDSNKWRRVKILDVPCNGTVQVFALDHGITEYIDWRLLRKLRDNYRSVDAQAVPIALSDIKSSIDPTNECCWPIETIQFLQKQLNGKITRMEVDQQSKETLHVTLFECHEEEDLCINALLVEENLAVSSGQKSLQVYTSKNTKVQYFKQMSTSMIIDDKFWLAIKMVLVESPGCFYVTPIKWNKELIKFNETLYKYYSKETCPEKIWEINSICVVKSNENNQFYRAIITDTLNNNMYKVFMKDIGRTEILSTKNMYVLEDQFGIHDYAIKCRLGGMIPSGGGKDWPHSANDYFHKVLELYTQLYITQCEPVTDKVLPVDLISKWEDNNGPLNPASTHRILLNTLMFEAGLAIPVKTNRTDGDTEQQQQQPSMFSNELEEHHINDVDANDDDSIIVESSNDVLGPRPKEWLKPNRLQDVHFKAWPSYVDHDGFIYLHTAKTRAMLPNVKRVIENYFKKKTIIVDDNNSNKRREWNVGDMCTVQYHLDKSLCRGSIIDVQVNGKIIVQLIDYGNTEECTAKELRADVLMTDQPPLAVKCALANVVPKTENNSWPLAILDSLHLTIVEKECEIYLENDGYLDDQLPEITILINNVCINTTIMNWDWEKNKKTQVTSTTGKINKSISDDDSSVIIEENDHHLNRSGDDVVIIEKELKYNYVQLPENVERFKAVVVNFIDFQSPLIEPDFVQDMINDTATEFQKMLTDINQYAPYLPKIQVPIIGLPCIGLFGADHFWYRAEILQVDSSAKEIKVLFVDYGNIEIIPLDDIKEIKEEWLEFSVQLLRCKIAGIQISPFKSTTDIPEITLLMKEEIEGKHVICDVQKTKPDLEIKFTFKDEPNTLPYQKLMDEKFIVERIEI